MYFRISQDIFDKLPNAIFGAVAIDGIDNKAAQPELQALLEKNIAECEAYFGGRKPKDTDDIIPYREAFRALGINPSRYCCSIEALMDRIAKGKGFPSISPAVDLGNAISIKYHLPIGAHDIDSFKGGGLDVRLATAGDSFVPFGQEECDNPDVGEAIYASGNEVRTRRWTWRQSEKGKITEDTSKLLYPIDGFADINRDKVEEAMRELCELAKKLWGDELVIKTAMLDKENSEFEF